MLVIQECTQAAEADSLQSVYEFLMKRSDEVNAAGQLLIKTSYTGSSFITNVLASQETNSIFLYFNLETHPIFSPTLNKIVITITSDLQASIGIIWKTHIHPFLDHILIFTSSVLCILGIKTSVITDDFTIPTKDNNYLVSRILYATLFDKISSLKDYGFTEYYPPDSMVMSSDRNAIRLYKFKDIYEGVRDLYKYQIETKTLDEVVAKTWMTMLDVTKYLSMTFAEYMKLMWKESPGFYYLLEKFMDAYPSQKFLDYNYLKTNTVFINNSVCNECVRNKFRAYQNLCPAIKQIMVNGPMLNQLMNFVDDNKELNLAKEVLEFAYLNEDMRTRCVRTAQVLFYIFGLKLFREKVLINNITGPKMIMDIIDAYKLVTISYQNVPDGFNGHIFVVIKLEDDLFMISQSELFSKTNYIFVGDRSSSYNFFTRLYNVIYPESGPLVTRERKLLFQSIGGDLTEGKVLDFVKNGVFQINCSTEPRDYLFDQNTCTTAIQNFSQIALKKINETVPGDYAIILREYVNKLKIPDTLIEFQMLNQDGSINPISQ